VTLRVATREEPDQVSTARSTKLMQQSSDTAKLSPISVGVGHRKVSPSSAVASASAQASWRSENTTRAENSGERSYRPKRDR
jgi:hypothetical protein